MMPRLDGYETVKRLKSQDHTKDVPVVIVTALNDVANQLKSIEAGADDFLSKPIEEKLLIAKVRLLSNLFVEMKNSRKLRVMLASALEGKYQGRNLNDVLSEEGIV
jgi:two-component system cell cycle response regulator